MTRSTLNKEDEKAAQAVLDRFADMVEAQLDSAGLPRHSSPIFRDWNLFGTVTRSHLYAVFTQATGGIPSITWIDMRKEEDDPSIEDVADGIHHASGHQVVSTVSIPVNALEDPDDPGVSEAARLHVAEVLQAQRLRDLGDLSRVTHLESAIESFLDDHPDFHRNVFIMMRFLDTVQMEAIEKAIRGELAQHGFRGVRADDRDYTGELWSNVQVYLHGCKYGIAVFEDIEERAHNPNVALELGYMLALGKRCLLLKEQRLPAVPTDVVGRLYKPFDAFDIERSVRQKVRDWTTIDLR